MALGYDVFIAFLFVYHTVNLSPYRHSSQVTVVNKKVGNDNSRKKLAAPPIILGIVLVYGVEFDATLATPCDGILKILAFTYCP